MTNEPCLLQVAQLHFSYGTIRALQDANLTIQRGEIHALVGEHGAGKSSMAAIIGGELSPDSGTITLDGKKAQRWNIKTALDAGVKMVYQQILQNDHFTVGESLYYANKSVNGPVWVSKRRMIAAAEDLLASSGFHIPATKRIGNLNLSERTVIDILHCLVTETRLLIIDEGLDNLSPDYYGEIVELLRERRDRGMSVLFITHKIDDVYSIANRVSIMRNGAILTTDEVQNIDKLTLVRLTYTQIAKGNTDVRSSQDFYLFLKYNEAILRNLPLSLIVIDEEGRIKLFNDTSRSVLGWNEAYIGREIADCLTEANQELIALIDMEAPQLKARSFFHVSITLPDKNAIANIQILPVFDGEKSIGNIITIEDITEYERLQRQLILSEKLASVGILAAGVAHEINNPLEIIYNYLTFLRYNFTDKKLLSIVEKISGEIMNISGIVSNLVSFSDNKSVANELIDPNELCKDIVTLVKFNAKYKYIAIKLEEGKEVPKLNVNKNELRQVLLNLLKNSFEAMPEGGTLTITTRGHQEETALYAEINVIDEGRGLNQKDLQNIFLPFYSTKAGPENNMGLGLSISYSIIEKYHGSLTAQNNPEKGCTFTIRLPAAQMG